MQKSINVINHIHKLKNKAHMIISINAEKAFDKIQHPFIIKTLSKEGIEGMKINTTKDIYDKLIANSLYKQKLQAYPLRSGVLEVLATEIRQEEEIKDI